MSLLKMSLSAAVLILVITIIRALLLHKLPQKTFPVLWGVALCRLLVPFSIPSRFSIYSAADILKNKFYEGDLPLAGVPVTPYNTAITETVPSFPEMVYANMSPVRMIWFAGLTACVLFFLITHLRCRREYRTSLPVDNAFEKLWRQENPMWRKVQIRQSDRIAAPLTYGIFRPVVLLPKQTDWADETRLHYILTHEFVHIRRLDTLTKLVMATALCVHWFNPFVWLMYVLANRDMELSCDEAVVRTFGENVKSAYALTLLGLEEKKNRFTPLVNNFSKNAIEERIVSIMKIKRTSLIGVILALALVAGMVVVFATNPAGTATGSTAVTNGVQSTENAGADFSEYEDYPVQTEAISGDGPTDTADAGMSMTQGSTYAADYSSEGMMTPDELAKEYSVYEPFGLNYDKEKNCFYYDGKLVREFMDILSSNGEALESGKFKGSMRQLMSPDGKGEVNIRAVRDYTKLNADGEGELIGIEVVK